MKTTLSDRLSIASIFGFLALLIGGVIGWVLNIVALVGMETVLSGLGVLRIIGIFLAPIGAVLGFI